MPDKASRALRRFCLDCQGGHVPSVGACKDASCIFFPYRRPGLGSGAAAEEACEAGSERENTEAAAPDARADGRVLRVIRRFCLDCAGSRRETRECDARENCPIWSFRFGVLPATFKRVVARRRKKLSEPTLPGLR